MMVMMIRRRRGDDEHDLQIQEILLLLATIETTMEKEASRGFLIVSPSVKQEKSVCTVCDCILALFINKLAHKTCTRPIAREDQRLCVALHVKTERTCTPAVQRPHTAGET